MCCTFPRLQGRLKTTDHKEEIIGDWREKCTILKPELNDANDIIPEEVENSYYLKLKVQIVLIS